MARQKKPIELHKKPVPKSVTDNPLHGSGVNKVVQLGLSEKAIEMRQAGLSLSEITQTLNEKYLSDSEYKLSTMGVQRFLAKVAEIPKTDNRLKPEENINIYNEYKMLYDITIDSLEAVQMSIESMKKDKDYKGIRENSLLCEKLTARCQNLLQSMSDCQSKVYSYINMNRIVQITLDIIKEEDPEMYARVINRIKENIELAELMKKIKEAEVKQ